MTGQVTVMAIGTSETSGGDGFTRTEGEPWRWYQTGEDIHPGDRVTYGGNAGVIELVVEALTGDPEEDWLLETNGAGIMVAEPKMFGRVTSTILMRRRTFCSLRERNNPEGAMSSIEELAELNDGTS